MKTKMCPKCHNVRGISDFYTNKNKLVTTCNSCRAVAKEHYRNNIEGEIKRRQDFRYKNPDYNHEWYINNKEQVQRRSKERWETTKKDPSLLDKHRNKMREWSEKTRRIFLEMYGSKCACCGETTEEFLTIEHILGQVGKKKESSRNAYGKAVKEYQPDIYEILCMNCNHSKGTKGYCPHQK